jgi:hypothetical protein
MQVIKRLVMILGTISIISCNHYGNRSGNTMPIGSFKANSGDAGVSLPKQPQDGSMIVTPEGTRALKVRRESDEVTP